MAATTSLSQRPTGGVARRRHWRMALMLLDARGACQAVPIAVGLRYARVTASERAGAYAPALAGERDQRALQ